MILDVLYQLNHVKHKGTNKILLENRTREEKFKDVFG